MQQMKLLPQELLRGMYVAELDRPWTETHFEFQGFRLDNEDDLRFIRDTCAFVVIDLEKGAHPRGLKNTVIGVPGSGVAPRPRNPHSVTGISAASRQRLSSKKHSAEVLNSALPRRVHEYDDLVSVEKEFHTADETLGAVKSAYSDLLASVRHTRVADVDALQATVSEMEASIIRNPDAMMLLCHLRSRDQYSYRHALSSSVLAIAFGRHLGLSRQQIHDLGVGMLLADIGKVHLPKVILEAPRALKESEMKMMRKHVDHSVHAIEHSPGVTPGMLLVVQHHHERYNGSGYPRGLAGADIPMLGRISGIIDTYDAMTNDRVYAKGESCLAVIKQLYTMRSIEFQAELIEQFIQALGIYPIGTLVLLSNDEIGVVIGINRLRRLQPKVMLLLDADKTPLSSNPIFDLSAQEMDDDETPITIRETLPPGAYDISPDDYYL